MSNSESKSSESLSSKDIQHIFAPEDREESTHHDHKKNPERSKTREKDVVSIIYYQRKDSPKYFEIKKSIFFWWFVVLPALTLVSLTVAIISGSHLSPTHLLQNHLYATNYSSMKSEIETLKAERDSLKIDLEEKDNEIKNIKLQNPNLVFDETPLAQTNSTDTSPSVEASANNQVNQANSNAANQQIIQNANTVPTTSQNNSATPTKTPPALEPVASESTRNLGAQLSYLTLFKPVQGQKDRTRPAQISLGGFNVASLRDTISLRFNITPLLPNEQKISGYILVIMKGETGLQVYPQMSLNAPDAQISYSAGESFATQRFRPVEASFLKPRKSGQFVFTVLIFARNGDLIHTQTVPLFVRL